MSLFITFEGADGCGKTTQIELLNKYLQEKGFKTLVTREPGAKGLGEKLREILLNYDGECENQHGHNWMVEAFVQGETLNKSNILIDYKILKKELNAVLDTLDHKDLNELPAFKGESPSSEMISAYIYSKLKERIVQLSKVTVWETQTSCCSYFEAD